MDADLVMTDSSVIDRALSNTCLGKSVTFPILRGTTSKVQSLDKLFDLLIEGSIWGRSNSKNRVDAYGTAIFYLYDNPIGYWYVNCVLTVTVKNEYVCGLKNRSGPSSSRTIHGKEDSGMYNQFKQLEQDGEIRKLRMHEPHLWHVYHSKATDWQKSADGLH